MQRNSKSLYKALLARDARFDGLFFVGVTSTDIYCRPVCPVKPPRESNCRFYDTSQEAEQAGFRPCLRCRPELAPGLAPMDNAQRVAHLVVRRIEEGRLDENDETSALEAIAREFALSTRQIRRIIHQQLGVPPIQLLQTRRLLLAKQLLTETQLPVTEIALASGFSSLRRFNDAFATRYNMPPTRLRRRAVDTPGELDHAGVSTLELSYRPPYDWPGMLAFLQARALKGVEWVTEDFYARTVRWGTRHGWIKVTPSKKKAALLLEFTHSLSPVLPSLLNRVRDLFDLNARPDLIARHLAQDKILGPLVKRNRGLRVPGAFNGFELGLRAILGQQITVKAATTIAGRLVTSFGEPISTPFPALAHLTPTPEALVRASVARLARLGIVSARGKSILALASAHANGELSLDRSNPTDPEAFIERLSQLPGIGPWTANYIAMRALRWPDAFPKEDIAVRNRLGGVTAKQAEAISQAWRPWRSYAVLHLWKASATPIPNPESPVPNNDKKLRDKKMSHWRATFVPDNFGHKPRVAEAQSLG